MRVQMGLRSWRLARRFGGWLAFGAFSWTAFGQVNSWTNPLSARWESNYWSLGVLPGANQSVFITNSGYKAVGIFASTVSSSPASLTVSNLAVGAPANAFSTLLLSYAGTGLPLRVLRECEVSTNGSLISEYSALQIDGQNGGKFNIRGGTVTQNGGTLVVSNNTQVTGGILQLSNGVANFSRVYVEYGGSATGLVIQAGGTVNGEFLLGGGEYRLTGGILTGAVTVGNSAHGKMFQYGGTNFGRVTVAINEYHNFTDAEYVLYDGAIINDGIGIAVSSGFPTGYFLQSGGYVQTASLDLGYSGYSQASYAIVNGVLNAGRLDLWNASFTQGGGEVTLGSPVSVDGSFDDYNGEFRTQSFFSLGGGVLTMPALHVGMFGTFGQSGGSNTVGMISIDRTSYGLSGGVLNVTNVTIIGGYHVLSDGSFRRVGEILQTGGTNRVANLLTVADRYQLLGGSLYTSNIIVTGRIQSGQYGPVEFATMIISNNASLSNPETIALGGVLKLLGTTQDFGALTLSDHSVIDFGTTASTVRFLSSSNQLWTARCVLGVTNWQGNTNGGGADRLYIGNSSGGITPSQLAQLEFRNPAGFAPGTYPARLLSSGEIVPMPLQINSWTNLASSNWENNYWSLGSLPASSQSVFITNAGFKAVGIFPSTVANYPNSLAVHNLTVGAPNGAQSTLLMNFAGTSVPLIVLDGFTLATNGTLLNLNSAFEVDGVNGGNMIVDGGTYSQEGGTLNVYATNFLKAGSLRLTNATASFSNVFAGGYYPGVSPQIVQSGGTVSGRFEVANGSCELWGGTLSGSMTLGIAGVAVMEQYAGTNNAALNLTRRVYGTNSTAVYRLFGGTLSPGYYLSMGGDYECYGEFHQFGGVVDARVVRIGSYYGPWFGLLTITNGVFSASEIEVRNASITQSGGVVNIHWPLNLYGFTNITFPENSWSARYTMNGGVLNVGGLLVYGDGRFTQAGGSNHIAGDLKITLNSCRLNGGSLFASNIVVDQGLLSISNNTTVVGTCWLAGSLQVLNNSASLGRLMVSNSAVLGFGAGTSIAAFQASSSVPWPIGAALVVTNWHGNANGGGATRFMAGTNGSGLNGNQLAQIAFVNPGGFAPGNYGARILATGEIVPAQSASLGLVQLGQQVILTWLGNFALQSATNVNGPYLDVPGASSPFTNSVSAFPKQFFRLRL